MRLLLPMTYGYQRTRFGAQLLTLKVDHQRKHILVTSELCHVPNHAPLHRHSVE